LTSPSLTGVPAVGSSRDLPTALLNRVSSRRASARACLRYLLPLVFDLRPCGLQIESGACSWSMASRTGRLHIRNAAVAFGRLCGVLCTGAVALLALDGLKPRQLGRPCCSYSPARRVTIQTGRFELERSGGKRVGCMRVRAGRPFQVLSPVALRAGGRRDVAARGTA
jgi:hypothetical protein